MFRKTVYASLIFVEDKIWDRKDDFRIEKSSHMVEEI